MNDNRYANLPPHPNPEVQKMRAAAEEHDFFHPQSQMGKKCHQRAGFRMGRNSIYAFMIFSVVCVQLPMEGGPFYVSMISMAEWMRKEELRVQSIWARRQMDMSNMKNYMTQRQNSWKQILGLKMYNISGDDNEADIALYKQPQQQKKNEGIH